MRLYFAASALLAAIVTLVLALDGAGPAGLNSAYAIEVDPVIWQFDRDYPAEIAPDASLPVSNVYIKTHDGTDWMSTYDDNPNAVSGPASIRRLIDTYAQQGVEVSAWFVPKGTDFDGQVAMALQVIDTGVTALYADVEPYQGFCYLDCHVLADQFWARVRELRPNAKLGVIYDPRPWWWEQQALTRWFPSANVALPMCYWEGYVNQSPWDEPGGCVAQAHADLRSLAPGPTLEYVPMLQGDSTSALFQAALDAAGRVGSTHVSVWRRGVTNNDIWNMIADYKDRLEPNCEATLVDGCLIREAGEEAVHLVQGQARFNVQSAVTFETMGFDWRSVQVVPRGFLAPIPTTPVDGTLLRDFGDGSMWVVYAGARFPVSDGDLVALGLTGDLARDVPAGAVAQVSDAPTDFARFQDTGSGDQFVILNGARILIDENVRVALAVAGHDSDVPYVLPTTMIERLPVAQVRRGDADCSGEIGASDVINILQFAASLPQSGVCTHFTGDVDCDGIALMNDGLMILLYIIGSNPVSDEGCTPIGDPQLAPVPNRTPTPAPPATEALLTDTPVSSATATPAADMSTEAPETPAVSSLLISVADTPTPSGAPVVTDSPTVGPPASPTPQ